MPWERSRAWAVRSATCRSELRFMPVAACAHGSPAFFWIDLQLGERELDRPLVRLVQLQPVGKVRARSRPRPSAGPG